MLEQSISIFNITLYKERVNKRLVQLKYIDTNEQVANGLTKALNKARFERFRRDIGLESMV
jgi:hypothetical protein